MWWLHADHYHLCTVYYGLIHSFTIFTFVVQKGVFHSGEINGLLRLYFYLFQTRRCCWCCLVIIFIPIVYCSGSYSPKKAAISLNYLLIIAFIRIGRKKLNHYFYFRTKSFDPSKLVVAHCDMYLSCAVVVKSLIFIGPVVWYHCRTLIARVQSFILCGHLVLSTRSERTRIRS